MLGFIGTGNMATAIIKGVLASEMLKGEDIAIYDCPYKTKGAVLLGDGSEIITCEPWNAESYKTNGKVPVFVRTPEFKNLNGNKNVVKIFIEE